MVRMTPAPAPAPEIPEEMVELAAVAIREADACGEMRDGERVFCDDPRLGVDAQEGCCCKDFGRIALTAAGVPALLARVAEMEGAWQPIETAPASGQFLVTDWRPAEDEYNTVEMVQGPFLNDGRILNLNSGNYTNAGVWTWWRPLPPLPGRGL